MKKYINLQFYIFNISLSNKNKIYYNFIFILKSILININFEKERK